MIYKRIAHHYYPDAHGMPFGKTLGTQREAGRRF